jgi:hypothetical protein
MGISAGPSGVSDGLVFQLDAANFRSYSGSGNTSYGLVGGIRATLANGTGYTSDGGGSFVFDGTNDYVITYANVGPLGANPRTICIWFYMPSTQRKNVYGYGQLAGGSLFDIITWDSDGFNRVIGHYAGVGYDTLGSMPSRNTLNVPGWNFVVHTYNGSTVSLYTNTVFSNSTNLNLTTLDGPLTLGKGTYDPYDHFTGKVSNIQIYNRVLTTAEIQQNFNAMRERYNL